jgi:hypothetical protein
MTSKTSIFNRIICFFLDHSKVCKRCGQKFGVPKFQNPPSPPSHKSTIMNEKFTPTHRQIISGIGTLLSSLNANSGIMAIVMSWGDTQDSEATLEMLNDYIKQYLEPKSQPQHQ